MILRAALVIACLSVAGGNVPATAANPPAPEAASGFRAQPLARGERFMVATANPHATDAAYQVLAEGGSAVDAAIAAQMMLALVEPQSSGIGGGAFMLAFDAASDGLVAWDGRETAPMAADERLFLDADGRMRPFFEVLVGGRSVGVPGVVRMLEASHREAGRLPWARLLQPAITAAEQGFAVSPRLHSLIARNPFLKDDPAAASYFHDDEGRPVAVGTRLRNPALAATLRLLAAHGSRPLHEGELARALVAKVRGHPRNPGLMTLADLSAYQARRREAVCVPWLRFTVCGMPPPSSGGIAVGQMLGILQATGFGGITDGQGGLDAEGVHRFSEAGRLAYADRDRFVADSDFVALPRGLLAGDYLAARAALVGDRSIGTAPAGRPEVMAYPEGGTSHVSVVDGDGNAVALTTSIEFAFGSQQMVGGFLLNNQLTDFSFVEATQAAAALPPVANRPGPGKRPRSSMAPTLVFERPDETGSAAPASFARGPLAMVTGSPGGSFIINYVAQTLIATLQDGLDPLAAIALPHVGSRNGPTELELGRVAPELAAALRARGHAVREVELTSGIQSIVRRCAPGSSDPSDAAGTGDGREPPLRECWWIGAADPRREGTARGQ